MALRKNAGPSTLSARPSFTFGRANLYVADCLDWLAAQPPASIHAVVTDPPYGLVEYTAEQQQKLRTGRGGVWRIPPSFDGHVRAPLPRFTTLTAGDLTALDAFFFKWAAALTPVLVPGAHVVIASNPLVSFLVAGAAARAGLERRGEVIRLVMTMRGGDRPKNAHQEFSGVSMMPRSTCTSRGCCSVSRSTAARRTTCGAGTPAACAAFRPTARSAM